MDHNQAQRQTKFKGMSAARIINIKDTLLITLRGEFKIWQWECIRKKAAWKKIKKTGYGSGITIKVNDSLWLERVMSKWKVKSKKHEPKTACYGSG